MFLHIDTRIRDKIIKHYVIEYELDLFKIFAFLTLQTEEYETNLVCTFY